MTNRLLICICTCLLIAGCTATGTQRSTGERVDDTAVTAKVKAALVSDPLTDASDIEIETFRGVVQLNGVADSDEEKVQATAVARNVIGVKEVENNLIVRASRSVGEFVDDNILKARVNAALAKDPDTSAFAVDVDANRGTVLLGGFVASEAVRQRVTEVVTRVPGVRELKNNLRVKHVD